MSDGEEEIAAALRPVRGVTSSRSLEEDPTPSEDEDAARNQIDDEDLHADLDGMDVDDLDVDMDLENGDGEPGNNVGQLFSRSNFSF